MVLYILLEKAMATHSSTLAWQIHAQRSLVGCSPWGCWESDATEQLHFHFSLSCIGEGNGNPLQCSCLENPRMGEPGGLPSMGSHRVRHDWSDLAAYILSHWSGPPFCSQLVFCMHFCVWRCIPDVFVERDVLHIHLLLRHLVLYVCSLIVKNKVHLFGISLFLN